MSKRLSLEETAELLGGEIVQGVKVPTENDPLSLTMFASYIAQRRIEQRKKNSAS